jgi:LPXTG-motif cell wall-anchored protein
MRPDKRGVLLGLLMGLLAWAVMAGPASANGHGSGIAVADNHSVASGEAGAWNGSTASGDAVAVDGSVASGCSLAIDHSTASGGLCPDKKKHAAPAPTPHKKVVSEAAPAQAVRVSKLAFTGPNTAPLLALAGALLLMGGALVALSSRRDGAVTATS